MSEQQFTTQEEAMMYLTKEFVQRGIVSGTDVQAEIAKVVDAIPAAVRSAYGEDDTVAAANFYPTYQSSNVPTTQTGAPAGAPVTIQTGAVTERKTTQREVYTTPALSDAQQEKVKSLLESTQEARMRNTPLTKIDRILVRLPRPSKYLADVKVIPTADAEQLAKYEKQLVQTEENIAAFKKVKAAVGKTAMEPYLNDKNAKIEGARVSTPKVGEGKTENEVVTLTMDGLAGFLSTRVIGRIPSDPVVGVELQSLRKANKSGRHTDAASKVGRPNMRWVGKAAAFEEYEKYVEETCEIAKTGNKNETREGRLRIKESFKIEVEGLGTDGKPKTRTIRLSGKVEVPRFKRKAEFRETLGEISDNSNLSAFLSPEEKSEALQKTIDMLASASVGELKGGAAAYGEDFANMVKELQAASNGAASEAASTFE